jgi:hypothetical protein
MFGPKYDPRREGVNEMIHVMCALARRIVRREVLKFFRTIDLQCHDPFQKKNLIDINNMLLVDIHNKGGN